jgi:hypothetical protein
MANEPYLIPNGHHNIQILDSDEVILATIIAEGLAQQPRPTPPRSCHQWMT